MRTKSCHDCTFLLKVNIIYRIVAKQFGFCHHCDITLGSQLQHFGRGGRGRVRSGRSCPADEHLVDIPVRYALFVQDWETVSIVIDGILETEIVSKRFWLLEGRFRLPDLYF